MSLSLRKLKNNRPPLARALIEAFSSVFFSSDPRPSFNFYMKSAQFNQIVAFGFWATSKRCPRIGIVASWAAFGSASFWIGLLVALWLAGPVRAAFTPVYSAFLADTAAGREPVLPDYSYAGYERGEKPLPFIKGPIFDVTRFGAVPDGKKPAFAAIQKAIDACEAAGGGVVWFPKGVYAINPGPSHTDQPRLRIQKSGVVLRGDGSGADGSVLYMDAEIQPENPKKMWTGRPVISVVPPGKSILGMVGEVAGAVAMNQRRLPLKPGYTVHPGDRVVLINTVQGSDIDALCHRVAPHTWLPEWTSGINLQERHEVESVGSDYVVLKEGLLTPIKADQTWTLSKVVFINNVGIENLRFRGNWHEKFVHHKDWRGDSGWRGIVYANVENSWIRKCVFEDMNWPIQMVTSRQCTTVDLTFTGSPGHFGIQCTGTTNMLNINIRDEANHWHGPSLQSGACGTVYHRALWKRDGSFDSHAGGAYANLFECGEGGLTMQGCGGSIPAYPHHLHACVIWNHLQTSAYGKPVDFWAEPPTGYASTFAQPILVGLSGVALDFRHVFLQEGTDRVAPSSLWLAQLQNRLGFIPEHFKNY